MLGKRKSLAIYLGFHVTHATLTHANDLPFTRSGLGSYQRGTQ